MSERMPVIPSKEPVRKYRSLHTAGQQAVHAVVDALAIGLAEQEAAPPEELRQIPLYRSPAAAGYASPAFGEDFDFYEGAGRGMVGYL